MEVTIVIEVKHDLVDSSNIVGGDKLIQLDGGNAPYSSDSEDYND